MKYFKNVKDMAELKKQYKQLAKRYHPDLGGSDEIMREVNDEYEKLKKRISSGFTGEDAQEAESTADQYKEIIMELVRIDEIEIEVIGTWVWVYGKTHPHRETLKKLGFRWSAGKKKWYKPLAPYYRRGRGTGYSMERIREMYGSQKVKSKGKTRGNREDGDDKLRLQA